MGHDQAPRGSGRGGRGHSRFHRGKGNLKRNQSSSSKQAEPLMKFGVNTANTNFAPYATIHEKMTTYIQKNYDCGHDVAKSIRTGQLVDLDAKKPIRTLAAGDKKAKRKLIQYGLDIEFSA